MRKMMKAMKPRAAPTAHTIKHQRQESSSLSRILMPKIMTPAALLATEESKEIHNITGMELHFLLSFHHLKKIFNDIFYNHFPLLPLTSSSPPPPPHTHPPPNPIFRLLPVVILLSYLFETARIIMHFNTIAFKSI